MYFASLFFLCLSLSHSTPVTLSIPFHLPGISNSTVTLPYESRSVTWAMSLLSYGIPTWPACVFIYLESDTRGILHAEQLCYSNETSTQRLKSVFDQFWDSPIAQWSLSLRIENLNSQIIYLSGWVTTTLTQETYNHYETRLSGTIHVPANVTHLHRTFLMPLYPYTQAFTFYATPKTPNPLHITFLKNGDVVDDFQRVETGNPISFGYALPLDLSILRHTELEFQIEVLEDTIGATIDVTFVLFVGFARVFDEGFFTVPAATTGQILEIPLTMIEEQGTVDIPVTNTVPSGGREIAGDMVVDRVWWSFSGQMNVELLRDGLTIHTWDCVESYALNQGSFDGFGVQDHGVIRLTNPGITPQTFQGLIALGPAPKKDSSLFLTQDFADEFTLWQGDVFENLIFESTTSVRFIANISIASQTDWSLHYFFPPSEYISMWTESFSSPSQTELVHVDVSVDLSAQPMDKLVVTNPNVNWAVFSALKIIQEIPSQRPPNPPPDGGKTGAIIGAIFGSLVGICCCLVVIGFLVFVFWKWKKNGSFGDGGDSGGGGGKGYEVLDEI